MNYERPAASTPSAGPLERAPRQPASRLELRPPGSKASFDAPTPGGSLVTIAGGLSVVLGLFFLLVWFLRRHAPAGARTLPTDVLEVLGRATLQGKHQLNLVRCGGKLLLVSISSAGAETLTEITDVDEVVRLTELCRPAGSKGDSTSFRDTLAKIGRERQAPDAIGPAGDQAQALSARRPGRGREGAGV